MRFFILAAAALMMFISAHVLAAEKITSGNGLPEEVTVLEADVKTSGPTLLFSDSPEMVYNNGILYRDKVEGDVRIFFHHVNAMTANKKLAVMIKNDSQLRPVEYKIIKKGVGTASWNYMYAGKTSQLEYFTTKKAEQSGTLGFGRNEELLTGYGELLEPGKLLVGTIDLHLSRPAEISVLMCDLKSDLTLFNDDGPVLPMDEHPLRGTFKEADWQCGIKAPLTAQNDKYYVLDLAGSEQGFAKGIDGTTGLPAENYGNYGVMYSVDFEVAGEKGVNMFLNPLGGLFAGYGILVQEGKPQLVGLPGEQLAIGDSYDDMLNLGRLPAGKYQFIWSPPGASNLPVRLYWK